MIRAMVERLENDPDRARPLAYRGAASAYESMRSDYQRWVEIPGTRSGGAAD